MVIFRLASRNSRGDMVSMRIPFTVTLPSVGRSKRLIHRTNVLFPAPLMPMMP